VNGAIDWANRGPSRSNFSFKILVISDGTAAEFDFEKAGNSTALNSEKRFALPLQFVQKVKMLLASGSDLEIDTKPRGKFLSQQYRLERNGTANEATRAQKSAVDSYSTIRCQSGITPYRDESWVYYKYQQAMMTVS
jgi:hypothetical protein